MVRMAGTSNRILGQHVGAASPAGYSDIAAFVAPPY